MKAFIDTNIFVYATYPSFPEHPAARDFLKDCTSNGDQWYLSWNVVYEYLRVVTHPQLFRGQTVSGDKALENVLHFLDHESVELIQETPDHGKTLEEIVREIPRISGNLFHDGHNAALMREHDVKTIYTADTDLNRFKGLKVINLFKN